MFHLYTVKLIPSSVWLNHWPPDNAIETAWGAILSDSSSARLHLFYWRSHGCAAFRPFVQVVSYVISRSPPREILNSCALRLWPKWAECCVNWQRTSLPPLYKPISMVILIHQNHWLNEINAVDQKPMAIIWLFVGAIPTLSHGFELCMILELQGSCGLTDPRAGASGVVPVRTLKTARLQRSDWERIAISRFIVYPAARTLIAEDQHRKQAVR